MAVATEVSRACQAGQATLAGRLMQHFSDGNADGGDNLVLSPLSIHVALALMSAAADGDTLDEVLAMAGAPSPEDIAAFVRATVIDLIFADQSGFGGPSLSFACGAWTDKRWPLRPAYVDAVVGTFKGNTWAVDFRHKSVESAKEINAWVAKATRNLITEVINPMILSPDTVHVIANAIYFKGEWDNPFDKEDTADHKFHCLNGSSVDVPFLQSWDDQYVACHDGFKVLKMSYKVMAEYNWEQYRNLPKFTMCVFLPDARDGLTSVVKKIASSPEFLQTHLPTESVPVGEFRVPKFKLTFERDIVDDLKQLGLSLPFDWEKANMSNMLHEGEERRLYVHKVIHKAVIEMNEEGSEAAAVTVELDDDCGFALDFGDD